jgi:hypothetical protein
MALSYFFFFFFFFFFFAFPTLPLHIQCKLDDHIFKTVSRCERSPNKFETAEKRDKTIDFFFPGREIYLLAFASSHILVLLVLWTLGVNHHQRLRVESAAPCFLDLDYMET